MSRPTTLKRLLSVIPGLMTAALFFVIGTCRNEVKCERATDICMYRDGVLGGTEATFPITDVREVNYSGGRGKHGNDAQVELIMTNGAAKVFSRAGDDEARATSVRAKAFFLAGEGPEFRYVSPSYRWMFILTGVFVFGAFMMFFMTGGRPVASPPNQLA